MRPIRRALAAVAAATLLPLGLGGTAAAAPAAPAPAAPVVLPAATPQGPLVSTACSTVGTATTCELYAKTGTLTVASNPIPIWGFASTPTDPATLPGPLLVAKQGDTVTINLHNALAQRLALAIPNLTGVAPDLGATAGAAANGGAKAYTFTVTRPGTYLYEAGHTADGARQAAMGLFGAMIVRPSAGGNSAYGDAASTFDDEAALVLSEIDPAFNANPTTYDLRNYHPLYKLINGKAFPETDPVATAVGHKVLLRYVNAGLLGHAMGVSGTRQTPVGFNARPNPDAFPLFADTIPPGLTEDAVVGAPSAEDGARFTIYETAGRLDNAGSRTAPTSNQVAFGGMLTYLTTDAVAPTDDTFGPVATAVSVAPAAVTATQSATLTADFTDVPNGGSNITAAEYVIDDPGAIAVGGGSPLTGVYGTPTVTGATATLGTAVLSTLSQGAHSVYVRAVDSAGNWGPVNSTVLTVTVTGPATTGGTLAPATTNGTVDVALSATGDDTGLGGTVVAAEYFINTQGPNGTGVAMTTPATPATVVAEAGTIPAATVAALTAGPVPVYVHSKDSFGLWGPAQVLTLTVDRTGPTASALAVEPNPTDGTVGSSVDPTALKVSATFTEVGNTPASPIAAAEGFLDTPGADGAGFVFVAADGTYNASTEDAYGLIPLSQVTGLADGPHQIYVHGRDVAGNWGALAPVTLTVDHGAVVSGLAATLTPGTLTVVATTTGITLNATATSPNGAPLAAEWFLDGDPGVGLGRPVQISGAGPTYALAASVPPGGLSVGAHTLSVRATSPSGTWGRAAFVTVNVDALSQRLFADGFDTGTTANWAGTTGTVSVVAPGVNGTNQLQVSANGTTTNGYVVDTSPLNEARYIGSFAFTPVSLTTPTAGTPTVTLFSALTAANAPVFTVQYQRTAAGYRVRLARGGVFSGFLTVPNLTTRTLTVSFTAAGAPRVTLTASGTGVTGTATLTAAQVSTGLRVETVRLGLSAATVAGITGIAQFDTFVSSRS